MVHTVAYLKFQRTLLVIIAFVIMLLFSLILEVLPVSAQQEGNGVAQGLTLSPLRTELDVEPGTAQDKQLTITNNSENTIRVTLSVEEFEVVGLQYDYAFNIETQLTRWVTFSESVFDLEPKEIKNVTFRISVPLGAEPGGRYISMFASTDTGDVEDGIPSRQRVGSLIYLTVMGEITRSGKIISLSSPWIMTGPSSWTANLQNNGTTHYRSRYNIAIYPLIGNEPDDVVADDSLILPATIRLVGGDIPTPKFPGVYKIVYTVGLGDTPAHIETRYVLYFPVAAIIVTIFGLILALSLAAELHKRRRRKKRQSV